ncbi:MAG: DUF3750 domain-containing protein, partial [Polyangiaceae bacterium]
MTQRAPSLALLALTCLAGCTIGDRELALPNPAHGHVGHDLGYVAVLSGEMPEPIDQVSRHAWIIVHVPGEESLERCELLGSGSCGPTTEPFHYFGTGDVRLHALIKTKQARTVVDCLHEKTKSYNDDHPDYFPIPGSNSNTYVDTMLRRCDLHVDLPTTAIGKDYRGVVGVSRTSGGTGVQFESVIVGLRLGLT